MESIHPVMTKLHWRSRFRSEQEREVAKARDVGRKLDRTGRQVRRSVLGHAMPHNCISQCRRTLLNFVFVSSPSLLAVWQNIAAQPWDAAICSVNAIRVLAHLNKSHMQYLLSEMTDPLWRQNSSTSLTICCIPIAQRPRWQR